MHGPSIGQDVRHYVRQVAEHGEHIALAHGGYGGQPPGQFLRVGRLTNSHQLRKPQQLVAQLPHHSFKEKHTLFLLSFLHGYILRS